MNETKILSFIESLYEEEIHVKELRTPLSDEYKRLKKERSKLETALLESLSSEQVAMYEAISDINVMCMDEDYLDHFIQGFRLGGQCIYDVFLRTDLPMVPR